MKTHDRSALPPWFTNQLRFLAERARDVILQEGRHTPMLVLVKGPRGPIRIISLVPWGPEHRRRWRAVCEAAVAAGYQALFHLSEAWMGAGEEAVAYRQQYSLASYAKRVEVLMVQGVCRQGLSSRGWQLIRERPQDDSSRLLEVQPWPAPEGAWGESYLFSDLPWPTPDQRREME